MLLEGKLLLMQNADNAECRNENSSGNAKNAKFHNLKSVIKTNNLKNYI